MKIIAGSKVVHALHGIGSVETVEEKEILGRVCSFAVISFERLKIMVNMDQKNSMVRPLVKPEEVESIMDYLRTCHTELPSYYTKRYNMNLDKLKTGDVFQLCEVVKSLIELSKRKKLGMKDQKMLERARTVLSQELSYVTECDEENMIQVIEHTCGAGAAEAIPA